MPRRCGLSRWGPWRAVLRQQIDLDTTASELQTLLPLLDGNTTSVELRPGYRMPGQQIPLARLYEVVMHSLDMNVDGHTVSFSADVAVMLLAFEAERIGRRRTSRVCSCSPTRGTGRDSATMTSSTRWVAQPWTCCCGSRAA